MARLALKFLGDIAYKSLISVLISLAAIPLGFLFHEIGGGLACILGMVSLLVLVASSCIAIVVISVAYVRFSLQTLLVFILVFGVFTSFLVMDSVALDALGRAGLALTGMVLLASIVSCAPDWTR